MSHVDVELRGFEAAFFTWLGGAFRFAEVGLASLPLAPGRHFFVNIMPEVQSIVQTSAEDAVPYEAAKEPTISAYTVGGPGVRTGPSRWVKLEATLNLVLRVAGSFERGKALLEELLQFSLDSVVGKRVGGFLVKAATLQQRPTAFQRQNDDRSFAQATVRFMYVALNT